MPAFQMTPERALRHASFVGWNTGMFQPTVDDPIGEDRAAILGGMHFEGTVDIAAPRDKVWAFVMDPNQVGRCGPGVESIEVIDATHFKATAKVGIGFISARFVVNMEFAEVTPPDAATIKAHGQAPGSAVDATAKMRLSDSDGGGTRMDWSAEVNIAGTIASVGSRLIEGTANKMIGQTFDCMKSKLEGAT
jgi:carbon monoxide dehydrogenase subunit G